MPKCQGRTPGPEKIGDLCRRVFPASTIKVMAAVRTPGVRIAPELLAPAVNAIAPGEQVVFVISDQTRKTGLAEILPTFLDLWQARGLGREQLTFVVACGSHRGPTPAELDGILGLKVHHKFRNRVVVHNAFTSPCRFMGTTRRGTPVELAEFAANADAIITCGAVVFHYFAGFSGGPKSILPGLASNRTIAGNHSLSLDLERGGFAAGVEPGRIAGNPVAEDIAEGAAFLPVRASIQTVVGPDGRLAGVFAGPPAAVYPAARKLAERLFLRPLEQPADLVVASAGTAPNWVQSHKALVNAHRAVGPEGVIVLDAPCPEGLGSDSIRHWLEQPGPEQIIQGLAKSADINGQTALSTLLRGKCAILVTRMPRAEARLTRMTSAPDMASGLEKARARLAESGIAAPRILIMPRAFTVPALGNPVPQIQTSRIGA